MRAAISCAGWMVAESVLPAAHEHTKADLRRSQARVHDLEEQLLLIGRIVTLNVMQTREGWKQAGMGLLLLLAPQVMFVGKAVLQKRRHLRALDEVKKM